MNTIPHISFRAVVPLLAALGFCLLASAAETPLPDLPQCPPELTVRQNVETAPGSWQPVNTRKTHYYSNVSFYDGHPDQMFLLAPNDEKKPKKGAKTTINIWNLTPSAKGHWAACEYTGTSATVAMKLPDAVTRCEVEYGSAHSESDIKRWNCFGAAPKTR